MEFCLLGPVRASTNGRAIELGVRKQRAVLALLALEVNNQVSTERLVTLLWSQDPPATARGMIHTYVHGLRCALAKAGVRREDFALDRAYSGYVLRCDPERIDVHRFRSIVAKARRCPDDSRRIGLLEKALALWQGRPLADAAPEQTATRLCAGLEETRLTAWEDLLAAQLTLGRHEQALDQLLVLAGEHPFRPRVIGLLMLALHQVGRTAEALAVYRCTRLRLDDELGLDPPAQLHDLQLAILRDDVRQVSCLPVAAGTGPVPRQLPVDSAVFTGRDRELEQLSGAVADGTSPAAAMISVIDGMAGIGKTALAVHAGHRLADRFPDGQLYVNLRGFDPVRRPMSPADAIRGFVTAFGVPAQGIPDDLDALAALYRSVLADRRVLVELDNARDADQVRPLLPGTPGCLAIVTSRNQLPGLIAVEGARPLTLGLLSEADAYRMLARRLGTDRLTAEPDAVNQIIVRCARLPLALAIVAARAATRPHVPLAVLAGELNDSTGGLDALTCADTTTDLRSVFSLSYQALSTDAARLYRLVGVYPCADITANVAASLVGTPPRLVGRTLAELTGAHLLTERSPGRYTCHALLRAYAAELAHTHD